MTDRIGYDSDVIAAIPAGAAVAWVYADQVHDNAALIALQGRWPAVVLIDRGLGDPLGQASEIDIERGTFSPAAAPGWYDQQAAKGIRYLTVYSNRSTLAAVNAAMGSRPFYRHIATLDGTLLVPEYPEAIVQFLGASTAGIPGTGGHCDASIIRNHHWHPAPVLSAGAWVSPAAASASSLATAAADLATVLAAHA